MPPKRLKKHPDQPTALTPHNDHRQAYLGEPWLVKDRHAHAALVATELAPQEEFRERA